MEKNLADYPIRLEVPVLWGNQDLYGHVNNCVHIRWFESGRVAYWDAGVGKVMQSSRLGPILANIRCDYKSQIHYPDTVHIGSSVRKLGRTSLTMEHVVFCQNGTQLAAEGHSIVVLFDYESQRPVRFPPEMIRTIERIEGGPIATS